MENRGVIIESRGLVIECHGFIISRLLDKHWRKWQLLEDVGWDFSGEDCWYGDDSC